MCGEWEEGNGGEETASGSVGLGFTLRLGGATEGFNTEKKEMTTLPGYERTLDQTTRPTGRGGRTEIVLENLQSLYDSCGCLRGLIALGAIGTGSVRWGEDAQPEKLGRRNKMTCWSALSQCLTRNGH